MDGHVGVDGGRRRNVRGAAAEAGSLSTGARRATRFAIEAGAGRGAVRRGVAAEARCGAAFRVRGRGPERRRVRNRGAVQRGVAVGGGETARRGRGAFGGGDTTRRGRGAFGGGGTTRRGAVGAWVAGLELRSSKK